MDVIPTNMYLTSEKENGAEILAKMNYFIGEKIGIGAFATVYKAEKLSRGGPTKLVACKMIDLKRNGRSD